MASLQYLSCTTTIPSQPPSSSSRPVFPKQSQFITHAKRSHRLQVSCQNQSESSGQGKLDRRNMLLGLGGLYGAANLISAPESSAAPVGPPDLDSCHLGQNWNTGKHLGEKCCLESISKIVDYKLPPRLPPYRIRRPAHLLTSNEIEDYKEALQRMRQLPRDHPHSLFQQAKIHCAYCNASYYQADVTPKVDLQIHHNWLFFPFHRWYMYFFEKICGKLINKPNFSLPYWNWDNPEGMPVPPIFLDQNSSLYDPIRDPDIINNPTRPVYLGGNPNADPEQMIANNIAEMYSEMMTNRSEPTQFMGVKYSRGDQWSNAGEGAVETGSHNSVHWWVGTKPSNAGGEDMGNFYSAGNDPLFYCHHSNVDRMWALWLGIPTIGLNKNINDPDFLDAQFVFYDENEQLVRVKVEDCVDTRKMGYAYEHIDTPWQDYVPPTQTAEARTKRASIAAEKEKAENVFPLAVLDKTVTVVVSKSKKGKADEFLLIENITYDTTKFVKFDVFVNDEDNDVNNLQKASFAGTFSQVPIKSTNKTATSAIRLRLTGLYEFMDVADDDTVLVTLVPRHEGPGISIGGIKIVENSTN